MRICEYYLFIIYLLFIYYILIIYFIHIIYLLICSGNKYFIKRLEFNNIAYAISWKWLVLYFEEQQQILPNNNDNKNNNDDEKLHNKLWQWAENKCKKKNGEIDKKKMDEIIGMFF